MIPFMEKILGDYLRSAPDVAAIVGDRVATKNPRTLDDPWVRVTVYDDPPTGRSSADHHIAFHVQLDCFAGKEGTQSEASLLARTVRSLLGEMVRHDFDGAALSGAKATGSRFLPDENFDPDMDRYVVTGIVWAHSLEEGS